MIEALFIVAAILIILGGREGCWSFFLVCLGVAVGWALFG